MHIISKMDECQKMLRWGKPIKSDKMERKLWNIINCPDSAGRRGHGLDNQSFGNFDNFNSYGRNIFFATSKIFARFCNQAPKVKYCHEFTKGDFSQSSFKEVITLFEPGLIEEHCSFKKHYHKVWQCFQWISWSKSFDISRCKEIWPIKIASNYLGTNRFYNRTMIDEDLQGGFQLELSRIINHMTCFEFECSHWWKNYSKKILYKICSLVWML